MWAGAAAVSIGAALAAGVLYGWLPAATFLLVFIYCAERAFRE